MVGEGPGSAATAVRGGRHGLADGAGRCVGGAPAGARSWRGRGDAVTALTALAATLRRRTKHANRYVERHRRYCWPVGSIDDPALAPFQILASEGGVHLDCDHHWQMETPAELTLGIEGPERCARREPLRRVHECVAGVLALECEPLDPRL